MPSSKASGAAPAASSRVLLTLVAIQVMFGGFHVVGKVVLATVPPLALATIRVGTVTPLLLALAWRVDRRLPRWRDLPRLALLGSLGVFANQVLFILGLERTTATNAAILMPSIPVFAVAVAAVLGIERPGPRRVGGVALAIVGALVMLRPWALETAGATAGGNALVLANCLCYGTYLVLQGPVLQRLPWRTVIAWAFLFGSLGVVPLGTPALLALHWGAVAPAVWWGIAYIVLFPTLIAYALNTWAVQRSSPGMVAAFTTLQPLAAALLAWIFLGESVGWAEGAGFVLIVGGLMLVTAGRSRSRHHLRDANATGGR